MTRITVLLVLLTVFPLAGLAQDDDDAEFLYLKATYLAKTGQRQRAAIVRKELLRLYPRSKHAAETLWHLAAGRLPYPYSLREALHVARHLGAFPGATVADALGNVLAFDAVKVLGLAVEFQDITFGRHHQDDAADGFK